jgi:thymidylate synthase (FAD)
MRIIEPSFTISTPFSANVTRDDGVKMLRFIEQQARISHRSEDRQTLDSWEKFIQAVVIQHGDWSVTEHASITATIRVDRGVTHEMVRHRIASYTQESTRFVRYDDGIEFISPAELKLKSSWISAMTNAENSYLEMLDNGERPQEARGVLPTNTAATISMTTNLRNWRLFFLMRTTRQTHPDFRRITIPMLAEFQKVVPLLYNDITPEATQRANLEKAR